MSDRKRGFATYTVGLVCGTIAGITPVWHWSDFAVGAIGATAFMWLTRKREAVKR